MPKLPVLTAAKLPDHQGHHQVVASWKTSQQLRLQKSIIRRSVGDDYGEARGITSGWIGIDNNWLGAPSPRSASASSLLPSEIALPPEKSKLPLD